MPLLSLDIVSISRNGYRRPPPSQLCWVRCFQGLRKQTVRSRPDCMRIGLYRMPDFDNEYRCPVLRVVANVQRVCYCCPFPTLSVLSVSWVCRFTKTTGICSLSALPESRVIVYPPPQFPSGCNCQNSVFPSVS